MNSNRVKERAQHARQLSAKRKKNAGLGGPAQRFRHTIREETPAEERELPCGALVSQWRLCNAGRGFDFRRRLI